jgi:hypothetical protein
VDGECVCDIIRALTISKVVFTLYRNFTLEGRLRCVLCFCISLSGSRDNTSDRVQRNALWDRYFICWNDLT